MDHIIQRRNRRSFWFEGVEVRTGWSHMSGQKGAISPPGATRTRLAPNFCGFPLWRSFFMSSSSLVWIRSFCAWDMAGKTFPSREGHYKLPSVVCLSVCPSVHLACLDITGEQKGLGSPNLAGWKPITRVSGYPVNLFRGQKHLDWLIDWLIDWFHHKTSLL